MHCWSKSKTDIFSPLNCLGGSHLGCDDVELLDKEPSYVFAFLLCQKGVGANRIAEFRNAYKNKCLTYNINNHSLSHAMQNNHGELKVSIG